MKLQNTLLVVLQILTFVTECKIVRDNTTSTSQILTEHRPALEKSQSRKCSSPSHFRATTGHSISDMLLISLGILPIYI